MNESAIFASRKKKDLIGADDISEAIDRIQIGLEKQNPNQPQRVKELVAYHEAGHALLGAVMAEYDLVSKISIIPRGGTGGVTIFSPNEEAMESGMYSKEYLENRICVGMGGRIAEEILNGKDKVTTGASNDFQMVTNTAKQMVEAYGMSEEVGPRNVGGAGMNSGPYSRNQGNPMDLGTELQKKVDDEVDKILTSQYSRGLQILKDNKDILDDIANTLIEEEKINGLALIDIINKKKPELVPADAMAKLKEL